MRSLRTLCRSLSGISKYATRIFYAKFRAGDQSARIELLNAAGEVIETVEHNPSHRDNANTLGGI